MQTKERNVAAGVWIVIGALGLLSASLAESTVPDSAFATPESTMAFLGTHATQVRVGEVLWAIGTLGIAGVGLLLAPSSRGLRALACPLLVVAGAGLALQSVVRATAAVDAAVAGDLASLRTLQIALGGLETLIPLAMLGLFGLAASELRGGEAGLPRWATGVGTAVFGLGALSSMASAWFGNHALDVVLPLFIVPLLWMVAFGVATARGALVPKAAAAARATFAVQQR